MSAEFFGGDVIKAKLNALLLAKPDALKSAGLSLLLAAQKSIISGGPGFAPQKRPYKPVHQLLWEHGTLLRSLAIDGADNVFSEDDNSITVGSAVKYAQALNLGYAPHNLPQREFLKIDDQRLADARDAYIAALKRAWSNS
jgi:phage gpG-like protein